MDRRPFGVYQTTDVDLKVIVDRLGKGITGKEDHAHMWHQIPDNFREHTPTSIIRHHLFNELDCNQAFLVIADRSDVESQGLLVVNLDFCRYVDAIREKTYKVGDLVPSLDIGHVSWIETLSKAERFLFPRKSIAMFAAPDFHPRTEMRKIHESVNRGLEGRKDGMGSVLAEWESANSETLDDIVRQWLVDAKEKDWWIGGFVFVTGASWEKGQVVVVADTSGSGDVEQRKIQAESAGELLYWLYVGLIPSKEAWADTITKKLLSPVQ